MFKEILGEAILWALLVSGLLFASKEYGDDD